MLRISGRLFSPRSSVGRRRKAVTAGEVVYQRKT
jgi:hypothetical protein